MPKAPSLPCLLVCLLLLLPVWPQPAQAQVRRCAGAGGQLIYTDKQCSEIGATDRVPHAAGQSALPPYRGGCSRRINELVYSLSGAIDARDVNRLAMLYDFAGMSTRQGYAVMSRLDGLVGRGLVDVVPLYGRPAPVVAEDGTVLDPNADGYFPAPASPRRAPVGLRIEQVFGDGITMSRTTFGLRRRLGCWWLTF